MGETRPDRCPVAEADSQSPHTTTGFATCLGSRKFLLSPPRLPASRDGYPHPMNIPLIVAERGRVSGDLVLVDDFLNHRVDPVIIDEIGRQIAEHFTDHAPDLIVTAEASGIPPAMATARYLPVPVVYAKKYLGVGDRHTFAREVVSPTKGVEYRVEVARRALEPGGRTLIVDDFLSGGRTAEALGQIVEESGGEVLGFAFVIEKQFAGGRTILEAHGWDVWSIVEIAGIEDGKPLVANL